MLLVVFRRVSIVSDIVITDNAAMGSASNFWLPEPVLQLQEESEASPSPSASEYRNQCGELPGAGSSGALCRCDTIDGGQIKMTDGVYKTLSP